MSQYEAWVPFVSVETPGAPVPVIEQYLAVAAREFCIRSRAWRETLDSRITVAGNQVDLSVYETKNKALVRPEKVRWVPQRRNLVFKTIEQLNEIDPDWRNVTSGSAEFWTMETPKELLLYPGASEAVVGALEVSVSWAPTLSATALPEYIDERWGESVARGALSKLMKIPGKDWTNLQLAAAYGRMFEQDIVKAESTANASYGRPARTVRYGGL